MATLALKILFASAPVISMGMSLNMANFVGSSPRADQIRDRSNKHFMQAGLLR
jgi:hypothetical protein